MVNGTIVILPKQSPAATDKTVCLVQSSEHYPEGIHKQDVIGEDGQVVLGRQCASRFRSVVPHLQFRQGD